MTQVCQKYHPTPRSSNSGRCFTGTLRFRISGNVTVLDETTRRKVRSKACRMSFVQSSWAMHRQTVSRLAMFYYCENAFIEGQNNGTTTPTIRTLEFLRTLLFPSRRINLPILSLFWAADEEDKRGDCPCSSWRNKEDGA